MNLAKEIEKERKELNWLRSDREVLERQITTSLIRLNSLKRQQYEEFKNGKVNIQNENEIL